MTNTDSHIKAEVNICYANDQKRTSGANGVDASVYTYVYTTPKRWIKPRIERVQALADVGAILP